MKIAQFKSIEYGHVSCLGVEFEDIEGYMRLSEYVEVEFPPLPDEVVVNLEIKGLEQEKKKIQAKTEMQIGNIDRRISELLSLPAPLD